MVISLPLTCGTCGTKYDKDRGFILLRWCASCGEAMCPTCFPKEQDGLERCKRCIEEKRPTGMEVAGRKAAMAREEAFLKAFMEVDR